MAELLAGLVIFTVFGAILLAFAAGIAGFMQRIQ